jgi:hypothetical protein
MYHKVTQSMIVAEEFELYSRFGNWLIHRGLIDQRMLSTALSYARVFRCRIGDSLVALEALDRVSVEAEAEAFHTFAGFQTGAPLLLPRAS